MDKVLGPVGDEKKSDAEIQAELEAQLATARAEKETRDAAAALAKQEAAAAVADEAVAAQKAAEDAQAAAVVALAKAEEAAARAAAQAGKTAEAVPVSISAEPVANSLDVTASLDAQEKAHPEDLEWKRSIVDLMKLVGMDSSYASRKELAIDMGYSQQDIDDKGSAEMNMWLHKQVLREIAKKGGNISDELMA